MDSAINARLTSPQCLPPPPIHLRLTGVDGSSEAHLWLNSTYKGYFHLLMQLPFSGLKLPCQFLLFAGQLLCMQLLKFSNLFFWGLLKRNQKVSAKKKKKTQKKSWNITTKSPFPETNYDSDLFRGDGEHTPKWEQERGKPSEDWGLKLHFHNLQWMPR